MAVRYIGDAVIRITYRDRGDYAGSVCVGKKCWHFDELYAPMIGHGSGVAYDSSIAYDRMAAAAVGFGSNGLHGDISDVISEATAWAQDDRGEYEVRRSAKGKARTSNPKKITKTSTVSTTTTRVMNPGFFSNPWGR